MENAAALINHRRRNALAFWILGLCNNFAYVVMLSAAKDILEKDSTHETKPCRNSINSHDCQIMSTGSVLLADILPALTIKLSAPLFIHKIPFGMRHLVVVLLQALSFLIVAMSDSTGFALFGVVLASFGSGLGEISYLALSSNYPSRVVSFWSSGTGGAGIIGALAYASLTDPNLAGLSPKHSLFLMLLLPVLFSYTYWSILVIPHTVHRVKVMDPRSYWIVETWATDRERQSREHDETEGLIAGDDSDDDNEDDDVFNSENTEILPRPSSSQDQDWTIKPLLKFMIPLFLVYFAEYYINQGLLELLEFDCSHGFSMSAASQYRWFQVTYQLGVFVSRSSSDFLTIPSEILPLLAVFQVANSIVFTSAAIFEYFPHILVAFVVIFVEGLLGGASYVNTFRAVHKEVPPHRREYSMGVVSISDTIGIVGAGFLAMPVHNYICALPYKS